MNYKKSAFILFSISLMLFAIGCGKDDEEGDQLIITSETYTTSPATAKSNVRIQSEGLWSISEKGVCWSKSPNPTINDSKTNNGPGKGNFTAEVTFLEPNTKYYVRAYATYSDGTVYSTLNSGAYSTGPGSGIIGNDYIITSPPPSKANFNDSLVYGTVNDAEGNVYKTIKIGTQEWMAENLKSKKYNNGTEIPNLTATSLWINQTSAGYSDYYSPLISENYGRLYNWEAVNSSNKVCPAGWHVPSDNDWKTLEVAIGMPQDLADRTGERGSDQGMQLKVVQDYSDYSHWINNEHSNDGINKYGFSAVGSGFRELSGQFKNYGSTAAWWTSTSYSGSNAIFRSISTFKIYRNDISKKQGYSVRCVKD